MIAKQAFETYLKRERLVHLLFAKQLSRNTEDAEDVLQDATIRALRALDTLTFEDVSDAWFRQIIKNCFLDSLRYKSRRTSTTSLEALQLMNPIFDVADPSNAPKLTSEWEEECNAVLNDGLAILTSEEQKLVLGHMDGLSCKELSSRLNCGVSPARTKLNKALRTLRRYVLVSDLSKKYPNDFLRHVDPGTPI